MLIRIFLAVVHQTVRGAFRSRLFHVLLVLNLLAVILLPLTVSADGTATGELQLTLTYSWKAVTALLSLAAVWLGCTGVAREVEAYHLHLVLTKPAPRWLVWTGKWFGIFSMTGVIFLISSGAIYGLVQYKLKTSDFSEEAWSKLRNEVLVGRREFTPEQIDFAGIAQSEYERILAEGRLDAQHDPGAVRQELLRQLKARSTEVPAQQARPWRFTGISVPAPDAEIFVRYRLYVASTSASQQRFTRGIWAVINPDAAPEEQVAILPQQVVGGSFHEFRFPASMVAKDGTVVVQYANRDPQNESVIFQIDDGPKLLVQVTGFAANYGRGMLLVLLRLAVLAALGCAFGAAMSTPVAVFVAISYLVLSGIADTGLGQPIRDATGQITNWNPVDMFTHAVALLINAVTVSFEQFDAAAWLARGRLIEISHLMRTILFDVLIRGGALAAMGIWIFTRRELGKVVRR